MLRRHWEVREVSPREYHVIETRLVDEPEYILARCSGPVPAYDIAKAMFISQGLYESQEVIHSSMNALKGVENSLRRMEQVWNASAPSPVAPAQDPK